METKFEHYKEFINTAISNGRGIAIVNGKPEYCSDVYCNNCDLKNGQESCIKELLKWLMQEYVPDPILENREHDYLEAVIWPLKDKVKTITKMRSLNKEFISISLNDGDGIGLPYFEKNLMYKGMETSKKYSVEELGL